VSERAEAEEIAWKPRWTGQSIERVWKPARISIDANAKESNKSETTFFVALTDEHNYIELPRSEVKDRIAKGTLRMSQPIWHPTERTWKPAKVFPHLLPGEELKPLPTPAKPKTPSTVLPMQPLPSSPGASSVTPIPRQSAKIQASPRRDSVAITPPGGDQKAVKPGYGGIDDYLKKTQRSERIYGILTVVGMLLIPLMNWLMLDLPLNYAISHSEFKGQVKLRAHFRYGVQINGLVIHINHISPDMSGAKFVNMLTILANSSRNIPIIGMPFHSVNLAKGWNTQYVFRGQVWEELARERTLPPMNRAFLLVNNLYLPNGKPALGEQSDNLLMLQTQKQKCFNDFYATMVKSQKTEAPPDSTEKKPGETPEVKLPE
jgi:hypothetical protein